MTQVEAVRRALAELGDAPAQDVAAFVAGRYGVKVDPKFVPVLKATVRDREGVDVARDRAARAVREAAAVPKDAAA